MRLKISKDRKYAIIEQFKRAKQYGATPMSFARAKGITPATFYKWLRKEDTNEQKT